MNEYLLRVGSEHGPSHTWQAASPWQAAEELAEQLLGDGDIQPGEVVTIHVEGDVYEWECVASLRRVHDQQERLV